MPLLALLLLIILVATFGFWDTLAAILGGIGIVILVVVIGIALAAAAIASWLKRSS